MLDILHENYGKIMNHECWLWRPLIALDSLKVASDNFRRMRCFDGICSVFRRKMESGSVKTGNIVGNFP